MNRIKFNNKEQSNKRIENIINECEQYREQLIMYCRQYFDYDYETAEDCVQEAYVALIENLQSGIEIKNYKSWLYTVTLNKKNQAIKDKLKRNEYDFDSNEAKDKAIENELSSSFDYVDNMITDEMVEERALRIISELSADEQKLYTLYYWEHKKLKEIATILNITYSNTRKRHELLRKKIIKKIKEYEKE